MTFRHFTISIVIILLMLGALYGFIFCGPQLIERYAAKIDQHYVDTHQCRLAHHRDATYSLFFGRVHKESNSTDTYFCDNPMVMVEIHR